jgi:DNA-directed RNA polymerase subunit M/transcription elongation factor TFIIS
MTDSMQTDFNSLYGRPPNFCEDCGDLLDFELIKDDRIICQRCGGAVDIANIIKHEVHTVDTYATSKEWKDKLENIHKEEKELQRPKVKF